MAIYRLYTGGDQKSAIEELTLKDHAHLLTGQDSREITFEEMAAGSAFDWHCAPQRQWVIIVSGQLEIGLGNGERRRFGPGDARLVEDTTGQGHTTRVIGDAPCVMAVVPLARQG
jgi:quercetin dioxygenase-like cupin family protein